MMKRILLFLLSPTLGSKKFKRFYEVLKNISLVGLNYRNNNIETDGELFLIKEVNKYFKRLNKSVIIFDVGANVGDYSRLVNNVFSIDRIIYAFEPYSKAFSELKKLENEVKAFKPFHLGLSDKKEAVSFLSSTEYSKVGGLYNKDFSQYNFSLDISEQTEFDSLENFCADQGIDHIHFLKIDVEGHDFFVLKGAQSLLDNNKIDFIQFEYGAANYLSKTYLYDFFQILFTNYRIYRPFKDGLVEIREYNTDIEMHLLCNYVAINRKLNYRP